MRSEQSVFENFAHDHIFESVDGCNVVDCVKYNEERILSMSSLIKVFLTNMLNFNRFSVITN